MAKEEKKQKPLEQGKQKPTLTQQRVSVVARDGTMAELIYNPSLNPSLQFAIYKDGEVAIHPSLNLNGVEVQPPKAAKNSVETGLVKLAGGVMKYGSQEQLVSDLKKFIHKYVDVPEFWEDLIAHYILMTWVYDRFAAVPYLRFLGEGGTGKSRLLTICSETSYKGISAGGSTTASPLFRLIEVYSGTLVMDEADYKQSEMWSDLVKVLNQGYMRGFPVVRSEKMGDTYEPRGYDVYGPKIIGNRSRFSDPALEQRCLTLQTQERSVRKDIPRQLPGIFHEEARQLRNKLLGWRFDRFRSIQAEESDLLDLEPRLTQIGTPMYSVASDKEFRGQFLSYLRGYGGEQKARKPQALVVEALQHLLVGGKTSASLKDITEGCNKMLTEREGDGEAWTGKRVGGLLRSMGFKPSRKKDGYNVTVDPTRLEQLVQEYGLTEPEEGAEPPVAKAHSEEKEVPDGNLPVVLPTPINQQGEVNAPAG
jgi:hypothetical protein